MKAEFDKEIDSLLRQSARRGRAVSGAPPAVAAAHLDADEQSAYAENALPAAARAHYAAHLADCDDCRRSVTQLALAAGMPAQLEPREAAKGQEVSQGIGWRERLGALLAPRALRYAAPALALLLVGAVSFILLTRKTGEDAASVARHNAAVTKQAPEAQPEAHHAPQNHDATADATPGGESAAVTPGAPREEIAVNNNPRAEVAAPVTVAPLGEDAAPPPPPAAAPASGSGAGARTVSQLPTPAPTPVNAADAVTITSEEEAKTKSIESVAELRKLEQRPGNFENRQYENRQRESISGPHRSNNEQARNARTGNASDAQNRADEKDRAAATTGAPTAATTTAAKRSTRRDVEDSERGAGVRAKPVETRTVAGRKFRRQGDAWVDAAFNAGQSYTVVRRNSEQFRALVADEPELRRIAGALGGDVTVVWKGRAYRIR